MIDLQEVEINEQAIAFIKSIPKPLAVVAVTGTFRTGKSYLLNKMLLDLSPGQTGFGVGPSIQPCTKGLWI